MIYDELNLDDGARRSVGDWAICGIFFLRKISPVLLLALFSGAVSAQSSSDATELKVAQYNVQFLTPEFFPFDKVKSDHWPNTNARARKIARQLACYDIVALNETVHDDRRRELIRTMNQHARTACPDRRRRFAGGNSFEATSGPDIAGGISLPGPGDIIDAISGVVGGGTTSTPVVDDELTILSRYPITASDYHIFTRSTGADSFAAKGVLHARVWRGHRRNTNDYLDVFATHFNAESNVIKLLQLRELIGFVRARNDPTTPAIILGDFNIGPSLTNSNESETFREMMTTLRNGLGRVVDVGQGLGGTNTSRTRRIDHIFVAGTPALPVTEARVRPFTLARPLRDSDGIYRTLSDHMAVTATFMWPQPGSVALPPGIKDVAVTVTRLQATSTDSCNEFMDFMGSASMAWTGFTKSERFGLREGNTIGPDWTVNATVPRSVTEVGATINVRDEDDAICGGGDDTVDVNPDPREMNLRLVINLRDGRVFRARGSERVLLGRIGEPIFVRGRHGTENARMTIVVSSKTPAALPPPRAINEERRVTAIVTRLRATSVDSCNERMDFYGFMKLHDGSSRRFGVREGNDIAPDWRVSQTVGAGRREIDLQITIADEDDALCGGGDDAVDVNPDAVQTGLKVRIDLLTSEIWLLSRSGRRTERIGFVDQPIEVSGSIGAETARMVFIVNSRNLPPPPLTDIDVDREVTATINRVRATSSDSCNGKMDFYSRVGFIGGASRSFGVIEGNDIRPRNWRVTNTAEAGRRTVALSFDISDDDDAFCGGGDDAVDINPDRLQTRLNVLVDLRTSEITLRDRNGRPSDRLGYLGRAIEVEGTSGAETGIMTFTIGVRELPTSPPLFDPERPKSVSFTVTRLRATSEDSCNERMDFYGTLRFSDGVSRRFGVTEGNDIRPRWSVSTVVAARIDSIDVTATIRDDDDTFCGGGDDDVDVHPDAAVNALKLRVNLVNGRIHLLNNAGGLLSDIGQANTALSTRGSNGRENGIIDFTVGVSEQ